jgi:cysteine desulfurase
MKKIYLDWAATTPMDPELAPAMVDMYIHTYGNPSSSHTPGRSSRKVLEDSRALCAALLKVDPANLIFTSGGTEANTLPLLALIRQKSKGEIVLSAIEHSAVYELGSLFRELGYQVKEVAPDEHGIIQPAAVRSQLGPDTIAVAIMLVNNEIGSIQPIEAIAREVRTFEDEHNRRIHLHCDAVQGLGKIPIEPKRFGVDSMAFSGHKFMAPKGIGLMFIKKTCTPLASGGGQEFGMRPGTENVPAVWAFGATLQKRYERMDSEYAYVSSLRDHLYSRLNNIENVTLFPEQRAYESEAAYSPYIIALSVAPVPGEICARVLNDRGFAVGTGSACSSNRKKKQGRVIYSITPNETTAQGIIRVSFGPDSTKAEIDSFTATLQQEIALLQRTIRGK